MSFLGKIFGKSVAEPIDAIGSIVDEVWTSEDEKLDKQALLTRIAQKPNLLQAKINEVQASHRSVFVAGARPFILWVCGVALACYFIPQYVLGSYMWFVTVMDAGELVPYPLAAEGLIELVLALLGLGALRTAEKFGNKTR